MNGKVEQERISFVIQQVGSYAPRDDIVKALCERYGMNWQQAEDLVLDVEIQYSNRVNPLLVPIILIVGVCSIIVGVIYLLAKILLTGEAIATNSFEMIILIVVICIGVFFLVLFFLSRYENSIKEVYRCPHCGYLANYKGNEDSIFMPRFKSSTYYTSKKRLKTWHTTYDSAEGPEWDTYAEFEITDICRNCRQVRQKSREVSKVGGYRHPRPDDYD